MEIFNITIQKYRNDVMVFISGSVFVFYFIYKKHVFLNPELLFRLGIVERILIFIIVAIVIGKILYEIGWFVTFLISWTLFHNNKIQYIKDALDSLPDEMSFVSRRLKDDGQIMRPEMLSYIENNPSLKIRYENIQALSSFWTTLLGAFLFSLILLSNSYKEILVTILFTIVNLIICIYYRSFTGRFWHDCAVALKRSENKN